MRAEGRGWRASGFVLVPTRPSPLATRYYGGEGGGERRAEAVGAGGRHVAAHHLAEVAHQRQPEPSTTVLAGGGGLRLGERLEETAKLFAGHADAGVGDCEGDDGC